MPKKPTKKRPPILRTAEPLRLDLGSGPRPAEGFKGVDVVDGVTDFHLNLCDGTTWPWADNSVDELRSSHFIEHIDAVYIYPNKRVSPRLDALLWFFDEAFRIAKPGAVFTVQWPALQSVRAFQDPTHRRFIPHTAAAYWSIEGRKAMGVEHYGATCNWVGTVVPCIPQEPETEEDKAMALRADSSDEKQAWIQRKNGEQIRRFTEGWNYTSDFIATLRAEKAQK